MIVRNKIGNYFIFAYILVLFFATPVVGILAQAVPPCPEGKYCALSTIPGVTTTGAPADPVHIIKNIYGISIGIAAILAIGMMIWGGIKYATTEAISGKGEAKQNIIGALGGLLLLLSSYLILKTINVTLVQQDLSLGAITPSSPTVANTSLAQQKAIIAARDDAASIAFGKATGELDDAKLELSNAEEQNLPQAELDRLDAKVTDLENKKDQAAQTLLKERAYRAIIDTSAGNIEAFESALSKNADIEMGLARKAFFDNSLMLMEAANTLKKFDGLTNVFTSTEMSNMRTQLANETRYMDAYIEWKRTGSKGTPPQKPSILLVQPNTSTPTQ